MIARALLRLAGWAMPQRHGDWLRAMLHEYPHIPADQRTAFARGCLCTALVERIAPMTGTPPLRIVPGLFGAALLTVLCLANGVTYLTSAPVVGGFLLLAGCLWLALLLAVQAQTARGVARIAMVGALLYGAIGALALAGLPAFLLNAGMLKALALEGLILFATVFAIAHIPYFWRAHHQRDAAAPPV